MAEVAGVGAPEAPVGPGEGDGGGLQARLHRVVRAERRRRDEGGGQERERGGRERRQPPVAAAEEGQEVRGGRAERQAADDEADEPAAVRRAPADDDLHADGVDAGERDAGGEPCEHARGTAGRQEREGRVGERGEAGGEREHPPRVGPIGEPRQRDAERPDDEPCRHARGEQRARGCRQLELGAHVPEHGRGDEPERHRRDLGGDEQRDASPLRRHPARVRPGAVTGPCRLATPSPGTSARRRCCTSARPSGPDRR